MIKITTPLHDKRFTSPAVAWEWLRKQRPQAAVVGYHLRPGFIRLWIQTASAGQSMILKTKHGATRLEVI